MANWCSNYVTFSGSEDNVKNFTEEIKSLEVLSNNLGQGVRPVEDGEFMFDLYTWDLANGNFTFESKWVPALKSLEYLGRTHTVNIECEFEELGCAIFGRWSYDVESDSCTIIELTEDEICSVDEDENDGTCLFE